MESMIEELYLPVFLQTLIVDTVGTFGIYIKVKNKMVLYHGGGDSFTNNVRNNLIQNNIEVVFIRKQDKENYKKYLEENLPGILKSDEFPGEEKAEIAHSSITNIAKSLFESPRAKTITKFKNVISATMEFILDDDEAINNLIKLTSYDFTTYTHSVNVGIFAIGLAKILFSGDTNHNMNEIGSGFFLHDIGKSNIPLTILTKRGKLTNEEWKIMRSHPEEGGKLLKQFNELTEEARVIVMQHHERDDGKGYPRELKGDQIHVYSKICCIADVFEALTATRPYKKSFSSFHALNIMKNEMQQEFDPDFFQQFIRLFTGKEFTPPKKKLLSHM